MPPLLPHAPHVWFTPQQCAVLLDAHQHGDHWRAKCPAHEGDNPTSLSIRHGRDRNGNSMTLLHCFAHGCKVEDICAALGLQVRCLFAVQEHWGERPKGYRRSPAVERWRKGEEPANPDAIAQMLLEEMIVSDPEWIQTCQPARQNLWELAQADPKTKEAFNQALRRTDIVRSHFWAELAREME